MLSTTAASAVVRPVSLSTAGAAAAAGGAAVVRS
jgi:hypothetical protein